MHFLVKSFGDGVLAGGLNLFMWAGYIISLALYATAFGSYAATFVTTTPSPLLVKSLAVGSVAAADDRQCLRRQDDGPLGNADRGHQGGDPGAVRGGRPVVHKAGNLSPELWPGTQSILFGAGVLFIGYEGFGLVTNAAGDMRNPRDMLPRALYTSVILVIIIYLAVSVTVTGNLTDCEIEQAQRLCAGRGRQAVSGRVRFPADRHRGAVLHRLGDQRHALRLGQRLLHDRPRRRAAERTCRAPNGSRPPAACC